MTATSPVFVFESFIVTQTFNADWTETFGTVEHTQERLGIPPTHQVLRTNEWGYFDDEVLADIWLFSQNTGLGMEHPVNLVRLTPPGSTDPIEVLVIDFHIRDSEGNVRGFETHFLHVGGAPFPHFDDFGSWQGFRMHAGWVMATDPDREVRWSAFASFVGAEGTDVGDMLVGGPGGDSLDGGLGDDTLQGEDGNDTLIGGSGNDSLLGGSHNDSIVGGDGADVIDGGGSADTLQGDAGADSILGGSNNDLIYGGTENDTLQGGTGDDTIRGGSHSDLIEGEDGNDSLFGDGSSDTIRGGEGDDFLDGGGSGDVLQGDAGADSLLGGTSDDAIYGGTENDTIRGGTGDDTAWGGSHSDRIYGDAGNDRLYGEGSADTIYGGDGNDLVDGGSSADVLYGGSGTDTLIGGTNNDTLYGGASSDTLTGDTGKDVFVFSTAIGVSVDVITDYNVAEDSIWLEDAVFAGLSLGGLSAARFVANAEGAATTEAHRIIHDTDSGALLFDADGNGAGAAVQFATLTPGLALTSADFFVV
jgi:Ca2+-binding RTX toxin-like protein